MPDTPELPPSRDGKCPTCNEWLYFEAATNSRTACFVCKKCGTLYRGAEEWSAKSELGPTRPFSPPGYNPGAPTPDPPMPSWYRRRKR